MNLFLTLWLRLIISPDSSTKNVQQFPQIAPCLPMSILQQMWTVTTINFGEKLIVLIDGLSVRMLQMGSDSIFKPLTITFRNCLKVGYFLAAWKKTNVVLVHKNENKQILNNCRFGSLLPICGKRLEKIIFDINFQKLMENHLLNLNQSGFMPDDSCMYMF